MTITPEQLAELLNVDGKNGFDRNDVTEAQRMGKLDNKSAEFLNTLDADGNGKFSTAELQSIALNPAVVELLNREGLAGQIFSPEERAGLLGRVAVAAMTTQVSDARAVSGNGAPVQVQVANAMEGLLTR